MAWPKDTVERFEEVTNHFTTEVQAVTDWDAQSPVPEWNARDIVLHLRDWYPHQIKEAGVELELGVDPYEDPAGAWQELVREAYAALREHAELEDITRQFFISDVFMHTWDLARSQGRTPHMDKEAAAATLAGLQSMGESLRDGGAFGAAHECSEDAPIEDQLMAYVGRNPLF